MKNKTKKCLFLCTIMACFILSSCNKDNAPLTSIERTTLVGTWLENDTQKKATYEVTFQTDSASANGIVISNFAGSGQNTKTIAYLSGSTLSLKTDELLSNGWIVNGAGSITSTTKITWPYSLHDGATLTNVQSVFTKK